MHFHDSWILVLIPIVSGILLWARPRKKPGIRFPSGSLLMDLPESFRKKSSRKIISLRALSLLFILLALARPLSTVKELVAQAEGIDIMLAVDVSSSMLAEDFQIDDRRASRLQAVKAVIRDFIQRRRSDRIGMVVFAGGAYTVCPLTRDYEWLLQSLARVSVGMVEDNTALGSGLSSALNRLKDTPAKGKVVILLTDGRNNTGKISPLTAAAAAQALKIVVHTVGAGSRGPAPYPVKDPFGTTIYKPIDLDIDEDTLKEIASQTGGRYFRAADTTSLQEIFKEIDQLETTPLEERIYYHHEELFPLFLIPGLVLLFLESFLRNSFFRKIP